MKRTSISFLALALMVMLATPVLAGTEKCGTDMGKCCIAAAEALWPERRPGQGGVR